MSGIRIVNKRPKQLLLGCPTLLWRGTDDLTQQLYWAAFISVIYLPLPFGIASGYIDILLGISTLSFYTVSTDAEHLMIHLWLRMWSLELFQFIQTSGFSTFWKSKLEHITYFQPQFSHLAYYINYGGHDYKVKIFDGISHVFMSKLCEFKDWDSCDLTHSQVWEYFHWPVRKQNLEILDYYLSLCFIFTKCPILWYLLRSIAK